MLQFLPLLIFTMYCQESITTIRITRFPGINFPDIINLLNALASVSRGGGGGSGGSGGGVVYVIQEWFKTFVPSCLGSRSLVISTINCYYFTVIIISQHYKALLSFFNNYTVVQF